ncbi:MAG: flavin reductase [Sphaerochaetaceae bacterium]|nr:flavin reductase [Sphaerochaetaceae bacterium]
MHCEKKLTQDLYYIGLSDRRISLFENNIPLDNGISYNSYFIDDEKTALLDTVDEAVGIRFFENLEFVLKGRKLDYVVVHHMEPDHCATLGELVRRYPEVKIVCNQRIVVMIKQFFDFDIDSRKILVGEGDKLKLGKHELTFFMAPMVHWPEVMVSYDSQSKALFSADAFGCFGALSGNIFADQMKVESELEKKARTYYTNIVGKYGPQVVSLLNKLHTLEINMICSLHGPVWRENIGWYVEKYKAWATYTPEEEGVVIAYGSIYGNTENAANILARDLSDRGVENIRLYDVSVTPACEILAECFRFSHIVFASSTFNSGIFITMENLLNDIKAHKLSNRTIAFMENGTWAPTSAKQMKEMLQDIKGNRFIEKKVSVKSSVKDLQLKEIAALADELVKTMTFHQPVKANKEACRNLSYGLFVLISKDENKDNGCIINTVTQITDGPEKIISIAVDKSTYSNELIKKTGEFNLSVLSQEADFEVFKRFGFVSGRENDKFKDFKNVKRSKNGLYYLTTMANSYISAKVIDSSDYGTHTVFVAKIIEEKVISQALSATYVYYYEKIKPAPEPVKNNTNKKAWICKICGYIYYGDKLPEDIICPICKHGYQDFELLEE